MEAKWLDRSLILNPLYFTLCTSEVLLQKELKKLKYDGVPFPGITQGKGAAVHFLKNKKNETTAIVCLYNHSFEIQQIYALLVHEAVHIWQEIREIMGEKDPSKEFEAYSIQQISQQLLYEYKRQKPGKK